MTERARASILTRLTNVPLFVLAGVNVWMVIGFWGELGGGNPLPYQLFGACLAAVEVTFLVVAADAQGRGEVAKARIWRAVFAVVLCLNLVADFGAIVTKTKSDQLERAHLAAEYDSARRDEQEASAELVQLETTLQRAELMLPSDAIAARLRGLHERRDRYAAQGLRVPRALVIEITAVDQGLAVSRRADEVRSMRDAARRRLEEFGTRPETSNAQIQGLVELVGIIGIRADPENVRVVLAAALALVGKLVLVFGFWAVTPRTLSASNPTGPSAPSAEGSREGSTRQRSGRRQGRQQDRTLDDALDEMESQFS